MNSNLKLVNLKWSLLVLVAFATLLAAPAVFAQPSTSSLPIIDRIGDFALNFFSVKLVFGIGVLYLMYDAYKIKSKGGSFGDMVTTVVLVVVAVSARSLLGYFVEQRWF